MDINLLKRLIRVVEKSDITDFSVQEGDLKVRISKRVDGTTGQYVQPQIFQQPAASPQIETKQDSAQTAKPDSSSNLHEIKSPIVGTFYRAPAPDADPYIQVGDEIMEGTVLCIVEAMKLMNEIESDVSGKIVKILVENATPVEYNQPLFLIEKK
ncbi:MAG: acetyl-CoA carboxylase biotin carboxyl carrier protein [Melioribacteraceae bacterium]|nr:acetyl-CoA carboxylase biotin carboxyl carrier protein [Melioribacteraceae bacterium]MCO6472171.1 acetyl-CoA carboxylase biotin carboxyl carrier protein [Melioribacteraceae bacterium]MDD3557838.1 acetyl-CoA carboxylase biotin carboxyl carrier protein [Melioribacteraceae bacterium]